MMIQKKVISIFLALALICCFLETDSLKAAKKPVLNKKSISLDVGKSFQLKLKNNKKKVKWSSSKKKIVSVSSRGKVVAKKAGKANITAKAGKAKYICKVTVKAKKKQTVPSNNISTAFPAVTSSPVPVNTPMPTASVAPAPSVSPSNTPEINRTLVYDLSQEDGIAVDENGQVAVECPYSEFVESTFKIWECPFVFYDQTNGADLRGKQLQVELTLKNSGKRNLPELGIGFNYTYPQVYPFAYYAYEKETITMKSPVAPTHEYCEENYQGWCDTPEEYYEMLYDEYLEILEDYNGKFEKAVMEQRQMLPGESINIKFNCIIPEDAFCGDKNPETGLNHPIRVYIFKIGNGEECPYVEGDAITISGCKVFEVLE